MFPLEEPIPLPAPVWLFKVLSVLTASLHFLAVQLLIGGLLVGLVWAIVGRWRQRPVLIDAGGHVATRLPILMIYVINLGVPPLLFAQVLYGRAIYTSSILIGLAWISVIFLLMAGYSLLYVTAGRARTQRPWALPAAGALVIVGIIAWIYVTNMTLMLRPQVWRSLYEANAWGLHLNGGDPTVLPRWLFMVSGGLTAIGAAWVLLATTRSLRSETGRFVYRWAARLAAAGMGLQILLAVWIVAAQPAKTKELLADSTFYELAMGLWLVVACGVVAVALYVYRKVPEPQWRWTGLLVGCELVQAVLMGVCRSGLQDLNLLAQGLDIWDRQVATNWVVVLLFVVLFVLGLAVVGWLVRVAAQAKRVEQHYV